MEASTFLAIMLWGYLTGTVMVLACLGQLFARHPLLREHADKDPVFCAVSGVVIAVLWPGVVLVQLVGDLVLLVRHLMKGEKP